MAGSPDPDYLRYQYADAEKLRVRQETHARYSAGGDRFAGWLLGHLALRPGQRLLDVGCGPGTMHSEIAGLGVGRILALDTSMGMLREARRAGARVCAVRADAQLVPLTDASCDRVMANYVLFHVPDIERALREMRRVLRSPGRVLITTNGAGHLARLYELHCRAASELGYTPGPGDGPRFTLESLDLVRAVFPAAERDVYVDALVFPTADPVLAFYASGMIDRLTDRPADGSHRSRLLPALRDHVQAVIEREGMFRVEKVTGCFVADL